MSRTKLAKLGTVATISRNGVAPEKIADGTLYVGLENIERGGRLVEVREVVAGELASAKFSFTRQDLLFGKLRPNLGKIARPNFDGVCSTDILPLTPGPDLSRDYLAHFLSQDGMIALAASRAKGANLPRLSPSDLAQFEIPLPPIEQQRRIADVLDRADALRAKRREALALLDDLTQSIFLDMFGSARDRRLWSISTLAELLAGIDSGKSPVCLSRPANDGEWGVLKLGAVSRRRYLPEQHKALPEGVKPAAEDEVNAGDLLMVRKNTLDLVGACALVGSTPAHLLLPDLIFRLRLRNQAPVQKRYLHRALCQDDVRGQIRSLAGGSAGSMPNISKARLSTVRLSIPPPELQDVFGARVELVEEEKAVQSLHLDQIDALFASLQQRAFAGEL